MPEKVSIIIPSYNLQDYLADTIESALHQTYPDFEVIVVDDGSADASVDVCKWFDGLELGLDKFRYYEQVNRGLNATRNAGAKRALGSLLVFLDADDLLAPNYLEKTIPLMDDDTGMVATAMQMFGQLGTLVPARQVTLESQLRANSLPYCSLVSDFAFQDVGGYTEDPDIQAYGDWHLNLKMLKRGWKITTLDEPLFHYRVRPTSMRTEVESRYAEMRAAIQRSICAFV